MKFQNQLFGGKKVPKKRKQREWLEEQVDLTWLTPEQLGQAFHLLALPRPPKKLPRELRKLNPAEWVALECLLVTLLHQKQVQTVH
jgi:hypothetical protein